MHSKSLTHCRPEKRTEKKEFFNKWPSLSSSSSSLLSFAMKENKPYNVQFIKMCKRIWVESHVKTRKKRVIDTLTRRATCNSTTARDRERAQWQPAQRSAEQVTNLRKGNSNNSIWKSYVLLPMHQFFVVAFSRIASATETRRVYELNNRTHCWRKSL